MDKVQLTIDTIRVLSAQAIEKAKSGHPGLPLGVAPLGYALFADNLKFNPKNARFEDRDRFILSAGHGSMLLYSLLHLFGYDITIDDIKAFRQFGSKAPGHPEFGVTDGVEISTGPLGQGIANGVGMAIAESFLAKKFNKQGYPIVDHYTYVLCGDGCMMEGIESECASLAGTLKLDKLIVFYDSNNITIEGDTDATFTENVALRHEAQGWQVINVDDVNDIKAINRAIAKAKAEKDKPTLIIVKSVIGFGSPKQGSADVHGAPLGEVALDELKKNLNWTYEPFEIPEEVQKEIKTYVRKGAKIENEWDVMFDNYSREFPELAEEYTKWQKGTLPNIDCLDELFATIKADATRGSSSTVLNTLSELIPNLIGGSADLGPSNKSIIKSSGYYSAENRTGRNFHFGIREQAMGAIINGINAHGGLIGYSATFFSFSDYMKSSIRMSALMNLNSTYILTHDSIGVGEDGPTHQPIEQLIGLRSIPQLKVFRPCDSRETISGWKTALWAKGCTCLILSRQNLPLIEGTCDKASLGGYILKDCDGAPDVILIASGSEVAPTVNASELLQEKGIKVRVVSMPCIELFDMQSEEYKESVLPSSIRARVCVEAASSYSWHKFAGIDGKIISIDSFGTSAPAGVLFKHYGFTAENICSVAEGLIKKD